jgi:hypothetical protein
MKKTTIFVKTTLFSALLVGLSLCLFWACNKQEVTPVPTTQALVANSAAVTPDQILARSLVKTAAIGLLNVSQQANFRARVHAKATQAFDGETNVLLKDLAADVQSTLGLNLASSLSSSIAQRKATIATKEQTADALFKDSAPFTDAVNISKTINGFQAFGETNYLQIYVHNMSKTNLNQQPIIVLGPESTNNCTVTGYEVMTDGSINIVSVDEAMADSRLVWVVSLNERVDNNGVFVPTPSVTSLTSDDAHAEPNQANFRAGENYHVKINEIEILDRKECWYCGGAEVSIIGAAEVGCTNLKNFNLKNFISVHRWNIGDRLKVGKTILLPSLGVKVENTIAYVWYEFDKSDNINGMATATPCGTMFKFKSDETPYGIQNPYTNVLFEPGNFNWTVTGDYAFPNLVVNSGTSNIINFQFKKVAP